MKDWKKYLAEFLGTFVLVFVGTGVAITTGNVFYTALAFGLAVIMMAHSIGAVSGANLNPAVTLGLAISKRISWKDFGFYAVAQTLGALVASGLLALLFGSTTALAGNQVQAALNGDLLLGLLVEVIIAALFIFVILSVTAKEENGLIAGFVIALTLTGLILVSFNLTSAGLNPARSLAPALFEGGAALDQVWVFLVGPFVGAAAGAFLFRVFNK